MSDEPRKVPVSDLAGLTPYCWQNECIPEMKAQGDRVTAFFEATDLFYELCSKFNNNETLVPLQGFLAAQRAIRAKMLALKGLQK